MDSATSRRMTSELRHGFCDFAQNDEWGVNCTAASTSAHKIQIFLWRFYYNYVMLKQRHCYVIIIVYLGIVKYLVIVINTL